MMTLVLLRRAARLVVFGCYSSSRRPVPERWPRFERDGQRHLRRA